MTPRKKGLLLLAGIALLLVVFLLAAGFPYEAIVIALWSPVVLGMLVRGARMSRAQLVALIGSALLCLAGIYAVAHHRIVLTNGAGEPVHYVMLHVTLGRYFSEYQEFHGSALKMSPGRTVKCGFFDLLNSGDVYVSGQLSDGTQFGAAGKLDHRLTILGGHTQIVIRSGGNIDFKQH